jgi:2-amino-4-hydroxy-6-hydroxymethyldihydropteridine diphosphokinase
MRDDTSPLGEGSVSGHCVILSLGSNLGDRKALLALGLQLLSEHVEVESVSRVVESEPWGPVPQGPFLNVLVRGRTDLGPELLLRRALEAEDAAGRIRGVRFGPRTLDVDLIFFGDIAMESPSLILPHPRWRERGFIRSLLPDVAGEVVDPDSGRPVRHLVQPSPLGDGLREVRAPDWGVPISSDASEGRRAARAPAGGTG